MLLVGCVGTDWIAQPALVAQVHNPPLFRLSQFGHITDKLHFCAGLDGVLAFGQVEEIGALPGRAYPPFFLGDQALAIGLVVDGREQGRERRTQVEA